MSHRVLALILLLSSTVATADSFSFVAVGDTAYRGEPSIRAYVQLIELINETEPAFTIHVGDIWGPSVCTTDRLEEVRKYFDLFDQPLIYTPGDNEWTDCRRQAYGAYPPDIAMDKLRHVFYPSAQSFGKQSLHLVRQGDVAEDYSLYVENSRWLKDSVLFLTLNVPGSKNNLAINERDALIEAHDRNEANKYWLRDSFRIAMEQNLPAVVIAIHAEMFEGTGGVRIDSAYADFINELRIVTERYEKPILLVHGDQHRLTLDRPLSQFGSDGLDYGNLIRLQVYGDPEVRAVQINVDTEKPWVFGYEPLYLE